MIPKANNMGVCYRKGGGRNPYLPVESKFWLAVIIDKPKKDPEVRKQVNFKFCLHQQEQDGTRRGDASCNLETPAI